jgi:hypothetical protein
LLGWPPLEDHLTFLPQWAADWPGAGLREAIREWRAANDHLRDLEGREAGRADNPPIAPLAPHLEPLRAQMRDQPGFRRLLDLIPADVGVVGLDRLVVFQKHINREPQAS